MDSHDETIEQNKTVSATLQLTSDLILESECDLVLSEKVLCAELTMALRRARDALVAPHS